MNHDALSEQYGRTFSRSRERAEKARTLFPNGVTHDQRHMMPFPIYIDRQLGARKWDIDGHEFIDYWTGHGSTLLGHSHPDVVKAVQEQMAKSTHAGGCHEQEIEWGEWVKKLVPSCEMMRFTGSGTEATMMALRLSRMFTGRQKILKFHGHFHGWHDAVVPTSDPPYDTPVAPGLVSEVVAQTVTLPPNDLNLLEKTLKEDPQIAAIILEPTGGHWGAVPIRGEFLKGLRELTSKYGNVLVFDEVITGFRVSPGGAQQHYGVTPDLTSLAKILAGGLPGGCLVGKAEILAGIEFRPGKPKMRHPGTYNANPLSASAGIATLKQIANGEPCKQANAMGLRLRNGLNRLFAERNWPWVAYSDFSIFKILPHYDGPRPEPATADDNGLIPYGGDLNRLDGPKNSQLIFAFKRAMLLNGIDMPTLGGWLSSAHTEADIDATIQAMGKTIDLLAKFES